jgi:deferrochelatase/peroxidase EfeB
MRRRQFIAGGAALGAGAAISRIPGLGEAMAEGGGSGSGEAAGDTSLGARVPFNGEHQAGILQARPRFAVFAAFDSFAGSRADLIEGLTALSERARRLTRGYAALLGSPTDGPTPDSGMLGAKIEPDGLTVTIGFGSSLFDRRYGLARRRPAGLKPMTVFPDDQIDPAQTHGDLLLQLCANTEETLLNGLRALMRDTRSSLAIRWKVEGFLPNPTREPGASRNLLGFKDGTANPDTSDPELMGRLLWAGDGEPVWARGGTYQVVRIIRNRVEFWDRVSRSEQELMIGRDKDVGAPLGKSGELDDPDYPSDPKGDRIPLDAHIRAARPRTSETEESRILRRPYNYSRGVDEAGQLDMGLVFVAFNRNLERQFETVQKRLAGEPLVDYVVPVGGGYFFVPPGARDDRDWVGSGLFY